MIPICPNCGAVLYDATDDGCGEDGKQPCLPHYYCELCYNNFEEWEIFKRVDLSEGEFE